VLNSSQRGQGQTAYQILVASSAEKLHEDIGDRWDSGRVVSDRQVNVAYQGNPLASGETCWWKVRCWNRQQQPGDYSVAVTYAVGLLLQSDWQGKWIAAGREVSSPLLRTEFSVAKKMKRASVYISGLGYGELYINGNKVGDHVLDPGQTYYHNDQPFELRPRVLYSAYDVTENLQMGENVIGAMLGHGWYSAEEDIPPSPSHREAYGDRPRLLLQLNVEFDAGERMSLCSDGENWKVAAGPITYNDYNNGETYDARLENPGWAAPGYDDSQWQPVVLVEPPNGALRAQIMPAIEVVETIEPVELSHPHEDVWVYDMGQNFSGWCRLQLSGPVGTEIHLAHGAKLFDDGRLDARSNIYDLECTHIARQADTYILKGEGVEVWEPRFTLHGFRYVEMRGFPGVPTLENLVGRVVRSAVERTGRFTCSNPLVNQIHDTICWTFASNFQSVPQDAADRSERVAWLGDSGFLGEDFLYNFDTAAFWSKWIDDIRDTQKPDGDVPVVSPIHWRRTHDPYSRFPAWVSTYPLLVWYVYWHCDDERILTEHFEGIKALVEFLGNEAYCERAEGGEYDGSGFDPSDKREFIVPCGLGDHMEPRADGSSSFAPERTPVALTSTAYYYWDVWMLARVAEILGKKADATHYGELAAKIKGAFNREFLDEGTNQYATGSQTSNALPLSLGMVPPDREAAVARNLIDDIAINHKGHVSTGIIGINALAYALPECGAANTLYDMINRSTFPSWGYQISQGATTLWETWDGNPEEKLSYNMKMFGGIDKFFYRDLAGIRPAAPGYRRIEIKPNMVGDLSFVRAEVQTVRGSVAVDWHRDDQSLALQVSLPVNSQAHVRIPTMGLENIAIAEGGTCLWKQGSYIGDVEGISGGRLSDGYVTLEVESGTYDFRLTGNKEI